MFQCVLSWLVHEWRKSSPTNLEPENSLLVFFTKCFSCNQEEKCKQTYILIACIVKDTRHWRSKVDKDCSSLPASLLWSSNQGLAVLCFGKVIL